MVLEKTNLKPLVAEKVLNVTIKLTNMDCNGFKELFFSHETFKKDKMIKTNVSMIPRKKVGLDGNNPLYNYVNGGFFAFLDGEATITVNRFENVLEIIDTRKGDPNEILGFLVQLRPFMLIKSIIPKGSVYYKNNSGQIMTNCIQLKEK